MLESITMISRLILVILILLSFSQSLQASDIAKEKRWADQVTDALFDGDAVWLNDGSNDFLGIYTEAASDKKRAVIIAHGTGIHPDWQQVVQPLRVGLIEYNWHTLSIQMPVLGNEAEHADYAPLYDEVAPRINAAIKFLHKKGITQVVLLGHSQGASMSAYYLSTTKQSLNGFIAIGMSAFAKDPRMNSIEALEEINIPLLDLYANEDMETVIKTTQDRAAAAKKAGNKNFSQVQIPGNHFYDDEENNLVKTVAKWLKNLR